MVLKPEVILERLKELDTSLKELSQYRDKSEEEIRASLSLRWIVERGLIAISNLIFDIADHVLSGGFGVYPDTYEESLRLLNEKELYKNFVQGFEVFPAFSQEIQEWLKQNADL